MERILLRTLPCLLIFSSVDQTCGLLGRATGVRCPVQLHDFNPNKQRTPWTPSFQEEEESKIATFPGQVRSPSSDLLGVLVLATVPVVWGSYVPVVKGLYEIDPPIPGFVFSTAYFAVASASTYGLLAFQDAISDGEASDEELMKADDASGISTKTGIVAGAELGFYLFLGNALQVLGLKTVPSDRAGFLVQLTTIIVPLVQAALLGGSVSERTWLACGLALAGISIMGYDGNTNIAMSASSGWSLPPLTTGDGLILGAALVYSLHVVRLGNWANQVKPLKLVAYKATTELILGASVLAVLISAAPDPAQEIIAGNGLWTFCQETGLEITNFFRTVKEQVSTGTVSTTSVKIAVGATLWTGLVSTAYTTYAQSFGQRRVKPANANLIYSLQPIFTATFAYFLLGETMGPYGFAGGGIIGAAVFLAASQSFEEAVESASSEE